MGGSFGVGATFREVEKDGIVFMKRSWQNWIFFFLGLNYPLNVRNGLTGQAYFYFPFACCGLGSVDSGCEWQLTEPTAIQGLLLDYFHKS